MTCHPGRRGRVRAYTVLIIGLLTAVGITPEAAARAPRPDPVPIDPDDPRPPFELVPNQEHGPVIRGTDEALDITDAAASTTRVGTTSNAAVQGLFGGQVDWPIVPIHAVLVPDGRVLTYGTDVDGVQTGRWDYDVWDPRLGTGTTSHLTLRQPDEAGTDLFCSAQIVLPGGRIEIYGGDVDGPGNEYNRDVNQFRPGNNRIVRTGSMFLKRWYATSTMMPDGEVVVQGGWGQGYDRTTDPVSVIEYPEVRGVDGTFRELRGAVTDGISSYYPRNFVGPDGLILGISDTKMYRLDPAGSGALTMLADFPTANWGYTSAQAMFRPGRILQAGGGNPAAPATALASVIDINGASPQVTAVPPMATPRHWGTATVMADGRVLVSGGSRVNNDDVDVAYTAEIYDPDTNSWSTAATANRMRLYHSTSLLLPDATVLTMGGGTPGPETNLNAEIYYPPYLFRADGSPAPRPTISATTTAARPGSTIKVHTPQASSISRVTLVKTGSVTHSIDMDQRFIDLPFTRGDGQLRAALPANVYETPPGYYHVFVFDADGVPSMSRVIKIGIADDLPQSTYDPVINGSFEVNALAAGQSANLRPFAGWRNGRRPVQVMRRVPGFTPKSGATIVELDLKGANNRLDQTFRTKAGRRYTVSFWMSPRPGGSQASNRFEVFWNGTKLANPAPGGKGLRNTRWLRRTYTVTGSGSDTLSFREHDRDNGGVLLDNISVVPS